MSMLSLALTATCLIPAPQGPQGAEGTPSGSLAVRCGTLYTGDGPALPDVWLIVRDGRIEAVVEAGDVPDELPVLDASNKVVMPGIVAADSFLSQQRDTEYNATPDFVAVDGFDFGRDRTNILAGGVTTAYIGNGRSRLVPGQASVVKLFGDDVIARTIDDTAALQITLGEESTVAPALFEPTLNPSDDDPLMPAQRQYPSARISQLATLRDLFDAALRGDDSPRTIMVEHRFDDEPLRRAATGDLPLRIAAREAADILRALRFASRLGAPRLTIENPFELEKVAGRIARSGASVVVRVPVALSDENPGGEDRLDESARNRPDNAAIAEQAGLSFAIAPDRDEDLDDFLFVAGIAIRHGLSPEAAMRAITSDAAKAIGADDRVGSLQAGKDADFLILSGEPFAVGTMVEKTFVDGVPAFEREVEETMLAIRAGRVITAAGPVLRDATVIMRDGKIKAVGEELAVPYGARVIDMPDAVVTPGMINAFTSLGLSGDGVGIPTGTASQRIADVVEHDDELFAPARAAGLTTVLVSGPDGRAVSGRVAAIKTGAPTRGSHVLREIAALRVVHDAIGPDSTKPLSSLVSRGKKYIESWKKYEKALAEWEAGKVKKAEEAAAAPPADGEKDPITGTWECELGGLPIPVSVTAELKLQLKGTTVTGTASISIDGNKLPNEGELEDGKFEDGKLTAEISAMGNSATLEATIEDDRLTGTLSVMGQEATIDGERVEASADDDDEDDKPKKPKVDQALEPVRAWVEKKIPLVVRTTLAPAIADVVAFFEKEELPYVLASVDDAIETPDILGEKAPPVLLGPNLVTRERGELVNAPARLADRGVPMAFGTGDTAGARFLPLHAAHAIRWGLDPEAALRALTIDAAKMFRIDDRVGSLERGKDGDLVVFSGNPFEMTSRVLLVVCNGRVVHDARGGNER